MRKSIVQTIPAHFSFVEALAAGLLDCFRSSPEVLSSTRVLLPTRHAKRSLALAFLRHSKSAALLLPQLSAIGDSDEEDESLNVDDELRIDLLKVPPAVSPLRRQLLLTRLVLSYHGSRISIESAHHLAVELATLLDQAHTERANLERLPELAEGDYAHHWQKSLRFLEIVTKQWPLILSEEGSIDPADRRNRILSLLKKHFLLHPPTTPVIVAGSTGSIPATAELIKVIIGLPQGMAVLPGFDPTMEDTLWDAVLASPAHPQHGMAKLLECLGIHRKEVGVWSAPSRLQSLAHRTSLIARALIPAEASENLRLTESIPSDACDSINRFDADDLGAEARSVALILRQAIDSDNQTAALVTTDHSLASRVSIELERWNISIDVSMGCSLSETDPGTIFRLVAQLIAERISASSLIAILKHPLAALGYSSEEYNHAVQHLECTLLRGSRLPPGVNGLVEASRSDHICRDAVDRLVQAIRRFDRTFGTHQPSLRELIVTHVEAVEAICQSDTEVGASRLWANEAGEALSLFFSELLEFADSFGSLSSESYSALLDVLLARNVVRQASLGHPKVAIWGPLEARLQRADVMVLGGLNEESWPPSIQSNSWLNRSMAERVGLADPERRIGLSAHDFMQAFCAPIVWLTRSRYKDGAPTVPSRWLLRLECVMDAMGSTKWLSSSPPLNHWQEILDKPRFVRAIHQPKPTPPRTARPRSLSVTEVEMWMRDPYSVYARHVLDLKALKPMSPEPTPAEYGTFVHKTLELFTSYTLDEDSHAVSDLERLLNCGRQALGNAFDHPWIRTFWWSRFKRTAPWIVDNERQHRKRVRSTAAEVFGRLALKRPGGEFTLSAKADRVDVLHDGTLAIIDYKTGSTPKQKEVEAGLAPQLPLEAAIAMKGGFATIPAARIGDLLYWRLKGDRQGGRIQRVQSDPDSLARAAIEGIVALIDTFDDERTCYYARPRPDHAPRYSDYEHLARIKEWSTSAGTLDE